MAGVERNGVVGVLVQAAALGTYVGMLVAYRRRRRDPRFDEFAIVTRWMVAVRARYAIAVVAALVWIFIFSLVVEDQGPLLQLAGIPVGTLIFGAIAWPDDFKRNPPTKRDGPPGA
jgi:hypothetical protein